MAPQDKKSVSEPVAEPVAGIDEQSADKASAGEQPRFVPCQIVGPDGIARPGWELWLGDRYFGRADQKEGLLRSLERQQQPPQSFHWREVHRQRLERNRLPKSAEGEEENEEEGELDEKKEEKVD